MMKRRRTTGNSQIETLVFKAASITMSSLGQMLCGFEYKCRIFLQPVCFQVYAEAHINIVVAFK